MMTVAEFAKTENVSVQTIYRRLNRVKQINSDVLTVKKAGKTYITTKGQDALTEDVKKDDNVLNTVKQDENSEVAFLREQNRELQAELSKAHNRLADIAEQLAEITRNNQMLLGAEQSRTNPALLPTAEPTPTESKKGFWGRFTRNRNKQT